MALRATRRRILGLMAAGLGATTLAACGEAQVVTKEVPVEKTVVKEVPVEKVVTQVVEKTVTKEVPVEKVVTKEVEKVVTQIVEKVVTAPPQAPVNFIRYVSNHTAGPRGNAMKWALERFAQSRPEIKVRFEPAGALRDILPAQFAAGIAPDATLFTQAWFIEFLPQGAFAEISGAIAKLKDFNKADYYFLPDAYTDNKSDHSFPAPQLMNGPQYGMPFQAAISGFVANVTLAEKAGVTLPSKELSWTWNDWTEWDKKMTNPDAKTFGTQIANSPDFGWWPQMYSNGLKKPFNDALTKSMYDQPEAIEAFKYWVDKIFVQKVAPPIELHKELAAEFGGPFDAGRVGILPGGRVYTTGFGTPVIKDRFKWTLLPEVIAKQGLPPGHAWNDQANIVSATATRNGTVEAATVFLAFLAGEEVADRVGIDRGHMPVNKKSIRKPASVAPPPEGMQWLAVYADRPDNRHLYPWQQWEEWSSSFRPMADKAFVGEVPAEQVLKNIVEFTNKLLSKYTGPKPTVSKPVYP